jgi:hypothetical protein
MSWKHCQGNSMSKVATIAADKGDKLTAVAAFAHIAIQLCGIATPAMAMLALSVREGDVPAAQRYWQMSV